MDNITPMLPPTGLNSDFTNVNPAGEPPDEDDSQPVDWVAAGDFAQESPASGAYYGGGEDLPTTTGVELGATDLLDTIDTMGTGLPV